MATFPAVNSGGPQSPNRPLGRASDIHPIAPLAALLLILVLTSLTYRAPRADTILMDRISWPSLPVGMYAAEQIPGQASDYRWTSSDAVLPLPNPGGVVSLQFSMGGHPGGTPGAKIRVGVAQIFLDVPATIRRYSLLLPPSGQERLALQIDAPALAVKGDGRSLGVMLGPVQVSGGGATPGIVLFGAGLLFMGGYLVARRSGYRPWTISGVLAAIITLALVWNAESGWRYAATGSSMLRTAALSLAALAYEQILCANEIQGLTPRRRRLAALAAMALISVGLPWAIPQPFPNIVIISATLACIAGYSWLRAVGIPVLPAYAGMLLLRVAALLAQGPSGARPLASGLLLIMFSVSWLALDVVPRREQGLRARLAIDSAWLLLSATVALSIVIHLYLWSQPVVGKPDIGFIWRDSVGIAAGKNPYARVLAGDMQTNDKYATYFPLFYLLGALVHTVGLQTFDAWLAFWRIMFLACDIGSALLIYTLLIKSGRPLLAGGAAAFWLLHRWTISSAMSTNIDFMAIFFLILSLALLYSYQSSARRAPAAWLFWGSLVSLSLSLAVKQIAIFLVPLYCIWAWQLASGPAFAARGVGWWQTRAGRAALALLVILGLPLLIALPFLAWNAQGFILSILFSATRSPSLNEVSVSASSILGAIFPSFTGITSRLIVVAALLWVYATAARREVQMFTAGLLAMAAFVGFNPVFFNQYLTWLLPFIALIACDHRLQASGTRPGR